MPWKENEFFFQVGTFGRFCAGEEYIYSVFPWITPPGLWSYGDRSRSRNTRWGMAVVEQETVVVALQSMVAREIQKRQ